MLLQPKAAQRSFARNTIYNVVGKSAPLVIAFFAMPLMVKGMGTERFGILTLAWMVIGYYSLFDLGLSRALTKLVAERIGGAGEQEIVPLAWTALIMMFMLGALGTCSVIAASSWLVSHALNIPPALRQEAQRSFHLLALALPFVICSAGLQGILEARQCFAMTNAVTMLMGACNFWGPLLVLPFSHDLSVIVCALFIGRLISCLLYFALCRHAVPGFGGQVRLDRQWVKPLLHFGGWMTVSNIINPLLMSLDRFVIGALLSMEAVAFYTTPYEMVMKLLIVPGALIGVFFPAFTTAFAQERAAALLLYDRALKLVLVVMFPVALTIITFGEEFLAWWLGSAFSDHSATVLKWLVVGIFLNSLALFPFSLIQGVGRPDLTAKIHMAEAPVYLPVIWGLIAKFGINGAAMAWTLRALLDLILLVVVSCKLVQREQGVKRGISAVAALTLSIFALAAVLTSSGTKITFYCLALSSFLVFTWFGLLSSQEKDALKGCASAVK